MRASPVARQIAQLDLGDGCGVAIWENQDDERHYDAPRDHTFSLYLQGGTGTQRLDAGGIAGRPGAICVMPEGCGSAWRITARFRFVHLYLSDARLRSGFAWIHDCDARQIDLPEATFAENPRMAGPLRAMSAAALDGDALLGGTAVSDLIRGLSPRRVPLRGGLAPYLLRRVDDWIEAHLDQTIHLADLALLTDLSPFHFHRMFQHSRGMAPHAWVTHRRVMRAQTLLAGHAPIAAISAACGFSSQSHMTRVFQARTGMTPARYRRLSA